jgi:succinate dehydrogenase / fumarate reductase cytochrome b subunit
MSDLTRDDHKEYRNIHITQVVAYRLPLSGIVSIMHRISGAVLFLALPFLLWIFHLSVISETSYGQLAGMMSHWYVKIFLLALAWGFVHHLCAGVRYILLDFHYGLSKESAHSSALVVYAVSLLMALAIGLKLFGVF